MEISGDTATITPLKEGLDGPTAVTIAGKTAWYVESQLGWLFDPANRGKTSESPFKVSPAALE